MADVADNAGDLIDATEARNIKAIREAAAAIPAGREGECFDCGEYSKRLVKDSCAKCRDFKIKRGIK